MRYVSSQEHRERARTNGANPLLKLILAGCGAFVLTNCMGTPTEEASKPEAGSKGADGQMIVKDIFLRSEDVELEKGKHLPKGTFILKPDQTEAGYIKSSSGPWEFGGLAKSSARGRDYYEMAPNYLRELKVIAGNSAAQCPDWHAARINIDLNRGAGGPYLFLCASDHNIGLPIVEFINVYNSGSGSAFNSGKPTTSSQGILGVAAKDKAPYANSDLNQGAGGDYVWARFEDACGGVFNGITGVGATWMDHWWETPSIPTGGNWKLADGTDLNYGAGGAFVYLMVNHYCEG